MTKNTRTRVLINKVHIIKYQLQNISSQRQDQVFSIHS